MSYFTEKQVNNYIKLNDKFRAKTLALATEYAIMHGHTFNGEVYGSVHFPSFDDIDEGCNTINVSLCDDTNFTKQCYVDIPIFYLHNKNWREIEKQKITKRKKQLSKWNKEKKKRFEAFYNSFEEFRTDFVDMWTPVYPVKK